MPMRRVRVVRRLRCGSCPTRRGTRRTACRGTGATPRRCRRAGCARRRSRTSGRPLCAMITFTPRSCAFWITGRPIAGSSSEKPLTVRSPRRVHLERGDLAGVRGRLHLVEARVEIAEVRRDHVVHEHAGRAAVRELCARAAACRAGRRTEPARRRARSSARRRASRPVVSLARNRSCRYAARLAHSSRFAAPHAGHHAEHELHGVGRVLASTARRASRDACARRRRTRRCRRARARTPRLRAVGGTVNEPPGRGRRCRVVDDVRRRGGAPRCRRAARRGEVDRGEHRRDAARGLQEAAPVHAGLARRVVGVRERGARDVAIVSRRRIRDVLAVGRGHDAEREPDVAVGIVVVLPHRITRGTMGPSATRRQGTRWVCWTASRCSRSPSTASCRRRPRSSPSGAPTS